MTQLHKAVAVLPGDGIGPEVTGAAVQVLKDCASAFGHQFDFAEFAFGGIAIDACGNPLPERTLSGCRSSDAILLGAIGGPKWEALPFGTRPEAGLLSLRKELGLYINLRPIRLRPALKGISPLRPDRLENCDFEIVRELAGDIYFGEHALHGAGPSASARDVANYSASEVVRVARYAFDRAAARNRHLTSVDKANVLATSTLWRDTVAALGREYPGIKLDHLYVDNAAMQIMLRPSQFDVILTGNLFGDILSDEAAALAGSIGLIPSLSRGRPDQPALYEPIHGSAPSLAGKDVACPLGAIFSATLMLRESFGLESEAAWIETAADRVLEQGYRTADIAEPGGRSISGSAFTEKIRSELRELPARRDSQRRGA
jgi:3-isopropylmalate dehydrogenase